MVREGTDDCARYILSVIDIFHFFLSLADDNASASWLPSVLQSSTRKILKLSLSPQSQLLLAFHWLASALLDIRGYCWPYWRQDIKDHNCSWILSAHNVRFSCFSCLLLRLETNARAWPLLIVDVFSLIVNQPHWSCNKLIGVLTVSIKCG